MPEQRLQKIIAAAGIASRRKAELLITAGRVVVNGQVVSTLGAKADPVRDHIKVDGHPLRLPERHVYLLLHKPKGYVTTVSDPEGRPTVMELIHSPARVFPVGRLDWNTEGLLLLTNDGDLTAKLTHASLHVPKTYLVKVSGNPTEENIRKLRTGVMIGGDSDPVQGRLHRVRTAPATVRAVREGDNPWYEITIIEGRNRQIRRMFEAVGHHVEKIRRIRYGPLELDVPPGGVRELRVPEIEKLKRYVSEPARAARVQAGLRPPPPGTVVLPKGAGLKPRHARPYRAGGFSARPARPSGAGGFSARSEGRPSGAGGFPAKPARPSGGAGFRGKPARPSGGAGFSARPARPSGAPGFSARPGRSSGTGGFRGKPARPPGAGGFSARPARPARPSDGAGFSGKPAHPSGAAGFSGKPAHPSGAGGFSKKPGGPDRQNRSRERFRRDKSRGKRRSG
jgi:23S rRNA pseudouridine2605 synthase